MTKSARGAYISNSGRFLARRDAKTTWHVYSRRVSDLTGVVFVGRTPRASVRTLAAAQAWIIAEEDRLWNLHLYYLAACPFYAACQPPDAL
jgi:hypothetical protein